MTTLAPSSSSVPIAVIVVQAVAEREGVAPDELPALYDAVAPEALQALFDHDGTNGFVQATFEYCRYLVTVTRDGDVTVDLDRPTE